MLIADASSAITNGFKAVFDNLDRHIICWVHLIRNFDKHLNLIWVPISKTKIYVTSNYQPIKRFSRHQFNSSILNG